MIPHTEFFSQVRFILKDINIAINKQPIGNILLTNNLSHQI